jgi:hypothetical protein
MSQERRRSVRLNVQVPATIKRPDAAETQRVVILDISGHGMRLATEAALEPGTPLVVEVKLPNLRAPVAARVKVLWSRPAEAGVTFVQLDPKDRALLMLYARLKALPLRSLIP